VQMRVPQRGDKKTLMETVARNASQGLAQHKLKRAADLNTRSKALEEIAEAIGMDQAPLRIECFDVSQIQGTDVVASMVVFEDGLARRSEYRRFIVRGDTDDLAAMSEVLRRRFSRYLEAAATSGDVGAASGVDDGVGAGTSVIDPPGAAPELSPGLDAAEPEPVVTARPAKFAYPPQLLVVDGGAPQVQVAARVLADLGIDDIAVCGLAKRLEEVWVPDDEFPVVLPRTSEALYLLQRVRDEAHRFAITFHRERRSKRMTTSRLDSIAGLGEIRRKALLARFGSVKRLSAATVEEIESVPGIGRRTAEAIVTALSGDKSKSAPALKSDARPETGSNPSPSGGGVERADPAGQPTT
jgi:excinuclease ABC subunit C